MNAIIKRVWRQDKMVNVDVLNGFVFTGESDAHQFVISGKNGDAPVAITGSITANFKNAKGEIVPLAGAVEDGEAVVTLTNSCYAVEGPFSLTIFADTICIYAAIANVINSSGEVIAYPTASIPSIQELIEEAQDVIASIPQDYSTLNQSVTDLKSATDNLFDPSLITNRGWTKNGDVVYGAINLLSGQQFMSGYGWQSGTSYTLSCFAKTDGNASSGTNNGLRIRFYYTDSTYTGISFRNSYNNYAYGALVSDSTKTVSYIEFTYSNAASNIWHIKNLMLNVGGQASPYNRYYTAVDMIARNETDAISLASKMSNPSALNQYVWDDLPVNATANDWGLDGLGTSRKDTGNVKLIKYAVTAGQMLWINAEKYSNFGVYQFQNAASVGSTGNSNPNIIGYPVIETVNDIVVVPYGATYLIVTQSVASPANMVKVLQTKGGNNNVLPGYWAKYIDEKAREISRTAMPPVGDGVQFMFITDTHPRNADMTPRNAGWSPLLMKYLHDHCNIGLAFFGGDALTGYYDSLNAANDDLMLFRDMFSPVWSWMYSIIGNHEFGNNGNSNIGKLDTSIIYNALIRDKALNYEAIEPTYGSYVLDDKADKVRFICLNPNSDNNYTLRSQVKFYCDALNDTPAGWTIVVFIHFTLAVASDTIPYTHIDTRLTKEKSLIPAIEAYNARQTYTVSYTGEETLTYNFANAGAEVACVIGGHTHWDGMVKTDGGVPVIATTCDMWTNGTTPITGMTPGTTTEQAFDVFTIDTANKTITTHRIGAGSDRSFTYGV